MCNRTFVVVAACLFLAGSAFATAGEEDTPFQWTGHVGPDQQLAIRGVVGSITVDSVGGDSVEVSAVKSGTGAERIRIEVAEDSAGVAICAIYPNAQGGSASACKGEVPWCRSECDSRGPRVDFIVHLPHSVRLLDLASVTGSITSRFEQGNWPGQLSIWTVSGNIELQLSTGISTDLDVRAPGRHLRSEFAISALRSRPGGRMTGAIGGGGNILKISTVSGYVTLRKNNL